jgi:cytochrome b pre-mRNA-processing protein 3
MFLRRLFRPSAARAAGQRLYAAAVAKARNPALYAELGAPDTPDGRFEVYTLHVLLLLERLRAEGAAAADAGQALFDAYLSGLDHGLRELAVGDLSVGKAMRKLGEAFYGRGRGYDAAIAALPDRAALEALLRRTLLDGGDAAKAGAMADYVLAERDRLRGVPTGRLLAAEDDSDPRWA